MSTRIRPDGSATYKGYVDGFFDEVQTTIDRALVQAGIGDKVRSRILQEDPVSGSLRAKEGMKFVWRGGAAGTMFDYWYRQTFLAGGDGKLFFLLEEAMLPDDLTPDAHTTWHVIGDSRKARQLVDPPLPAEITERHGGIYAGYDKEAGF